MKDKRCPTCNTVKPISDYWRGQVYCIPCHKNKQNTQWHSRTPKSRLEQHLKYKYGITQAEFNEAWQKQDGNCAICENELPDLMEYNNRRRGYAIDHNHDTGEFRGILCLNCNSMLGMSKDDIGVLQSAIIYLEERGSYAAKKKGK